MTKTEALEFGKLWLEMNSDAPDTLSYEFFTIAVDAIGREIYKENDYRLTESGKTNFTRAFFDEAPLSLGKLKLAKPAKNKTSIFVKKFH